MDPGTNTPPGSLTRPSSCRRRCGSREGAGTWTRCRAPPWTWSRRRQFPAPVPPASARRRHCSLGKGAGFAITFSQVLQICCRCCYRLQGRAASGGVPPDTRRPRPSKHKERRRTLRVFCFLENRCPRPSKQTQTHPLGPSRRPPENPRPSRRESPSHFPAGKDADFPPGSPSQTCPNTPRT